MLGSGVAGSESKCMSIREYGIEAACDGEERVTHKSRRCEIAESGLIVPGRDNKARNHPSRLHRAGNYLPVPESRSREGEIHLAATYRLQLPYLFICLFVKGGEGLSTDLSEKEQKRQAAASWM